MPASTIDEVVLRLDAIIRDATQANRRLGYFAALYGRVTRRVRDGIRRGEFEDNARMERLDVMFAGRYLDAYDQFVAGEPPTRCWRLAFETGDRAGVSVLQHLLLGMNAHINLDLGIAAARVAAGDALDGLRNDFDRINDVLASLVPVVEVENEEIAPVLGELAGLAHGEEARLASLFMTGARDQAWRFALSLALLDEPARAALIAERDLEVTALGEGIAHEPLLATLLRVGEDEDIAGGIGILAEGEDANAQPA